MTMTIGKVASGAGVNLQTVRYYERRGLLPRPPRAASGYRQYDANAVARLRFIKRAQDLGFSLAEIGELLELRIEHGAACAAVEARAREKIATCVCICVFPRPGGFWANSLLWWHKGHK